MLHNPKKIRRKNTTSICLWSFLLFIIFIITIIPLSASAYTQRDSLCGHSYLTPVIVGSALVGAGLTEHKFSNAYGKRQNNYFPENHTRWADWSRYAPKLLQLGLVLSGAKGRYNDRHMIVSDIIGTLSLIGSTTLLKRTTNQLRPDGTDRKSFPSGHAAVAFLTATMLDEEYGHLSPIITIGGYAISTATGFDRTRSNRHYAGDVLMGAGLGILSARLGYWIGHIIYNNDIASSQDQDCSYEIHPSFLGFFGGISIPTGHRGITFPKADAGLTEGLEGAWFPTRHWGLGGQISQSHQLLHHKEHPIAASVDVLSLEAGPYYSYTLTDRCRIGAKLNGGYSIQCGGRNDMRHYGYKMMESPSLTTALNFGYAARESLEVRMNLNYHIMWNRQTLYEFIPSIGLSYLF